MPTTERMVERAEARALAARRITVLLVTVALLTSLTALLYVAVQIRGAQIDGTPTGRRIESCTTPGMPCYERAQRQTAQAVANVNRYVVLAAACATSVSPDQEPAVRERAIRACIVHRLAADR